MLAALRFSFIVNQLQCDIVADNECQRLQIAIRLVNEIAGASRNGRGL